MIGSSGVIVPPAGYLRGVRDLCTATIVYIADEVLVGFGRTGAWFGVDHEGVSPDLLVFAKGVNSGYVPLGACWSASRSSRRSPRAPTRRA